MSASKKCATQNEVLCRTQYKKAGVKFSRKQVSLTPGCHTLSIIPSHFNPNRFSKTDHSSFWSGVICLTNISSLRKAAKHAWKTPRDPTNTKNDLGITVDLNASYLEKY